MALDTLLSNVIIEDNTFDYGNFPTDTNILTVPTTYGYSVCVYTYADCRITNNYFSGAISGSTHILPLSTASCNIRGNTFIRNNVSIANYINASTSSSDQIIVDNIFDSPTIDGTNETLVLIRTPHPGGPLLVYERNKNQTGFKQIQKSPYLITTSTPPTFNASEKISYTDSSSTTYSPSMGTWGSGNFTGSSFKQEGVLVNYSTPFVNTAGVRLNTFFEVTGGATTISISAFPAPIGFPSASTQSGFIVFGNDNTYYSINFTVNGSGTVTAAVLTSNYQGTSNTFTFATFYPATPQLKTALAGTFTTMNGSGNVTATASQSRSLTPGSLVWFNNSGNSSIYTISTIDSTGTNLTITPIYAESSGSYSATTGSAVSSLNFSINLSEVLPENVQIISTVFGIWGNNSVNPLIYADYNAFMTTDSGGSYAINLPGTFTVSSNNVTVTASVVPAGLSVGSAICFSSQSYQVYPVTAISGTTITLGFAYFGTPSTSTTAEYFNNTMADAANYTLTSSTSIAFGNNIAMFVGNGGVPKSIFAANTQYLKIDPSDTNVSNGFPYYTGSGFLVRYNLNITINSAQLNKIGIASTSMFLPESPLIIKYRW